MWPASNVVLWRNICSAFYSAFHAWCMQGPKQNSLYILREGPKTRQKRKPYKQKYISVSRRSKPTPKHTILRLYQVVCKLVLWNRVSIRQHEKLIINQFRRYFWQDGFRLRGIQSISDKHRNAKRTFQNFACPFVWPNCSSRTKLNYC